MRPLKNCKYPFAILAPDANTVILKGKQPVPRSLLSGNLNDRGPWNREET